MSVNILNINKTYKETQALKDVSINIKNGMFGLLGPNGAGKTTLMRLLMGLHSETSGEIIIEGIPISNRKEIRKIVSYLPQDYSFYPNLTVYEAMDYMAILAKIKQKGKRKTLIYNLLETVNLTKEKDKKVKALSGGMKRRLGIAQALIKDPKVLIVDEPTAGLDPEERIRIRTLLADFSKERIVILSTHIVEDIAFSCENLAVISSGEILYTGKTSEFVSMANGSVWTVHLERENIDAFRKNYNVISMISKGDAFEAKIIDTNSSHKVMETPTLEDAYIFLMTNSRTGSTISNVS